ncbi:MAG: hypothetical protein IPO03_05090 [Bacteroidetes bacterium]|nr:hypothetical protein [Bacteroidota bacterium]
MRRSTNVMIGTEKSDRCHRLLVFSPGEWIGGVFSRKGPKGGLYKCSFVGRKFQARKGYYGFGSPASADLKRGGSGGGGFSQRPEEGFI